MYAELELSCKDFCEKNIEIYYLITFEVESVERMEFGLRMICLTNCSPEENFFGNGKDFSGLHVFLSRPY